jgi:hypothetical protein
MFCPDVKATNCPAGNRRGRSDQGGKQMARPEHKGMAEVSKIRPAVKSLKRNITVCRPNFSVGKAAVAGEETGMCTLQTVVIRGPGIAGKILRDNVGKSPLAAGAGSHLQGLLKRDE